MNSVSKARFSDDDKQKALMRRLCSFLPTTQERAEMGGKIRGDVFMYTILNGVFTTTIPIWWPGPVS
jgi:hypothetical protein